MRDTRFPTVDWFSLLGWVSVVTMNLWKAVVAVRGGLNWCAISLKVFSLKRVG